MKAQFITNEKGVKTAVILPVKDYEKLLAIEEEYNDIKTFDKAILRIKEGKEDLVSFDDVLKSLKD